MGIGGSGAAGCCPARRRVDTGRWRGQNRRTGSVAPTTAGGSGEDSDTRTGPACRSARTDGGTGAGHFGGRRRSRRRRHGTGRGDPRPGHRTGRGSRLGVGHVEPVEQAHPRRTAVPGDAGLRARKGSAEGARAAAGTARAAPGQAGPVPLPAHPQGLGTLVRGFRRRPVRRHVGLLRARPRTARPPAPLAQARAASRTLPEEGRPGRRVAVLRRPDGRRPLRDEPRPHRGRLRGGRRQPGQGGRLPARGRTRRRRPGAGRGGGR